ncbi:hypothetical protein DV515_00004652, partial [Chloebia gouldiae]
MQGQEEQEERITQPNPGAPSAGILGTPQNTSEPVGPLAARGNMRETLLVTRFSESSAWKSKRTVFILKKQE